MAQESGDVQNATSSLTITNLNRTDEGLYKCVVSNEVIANVASSEAQLTVNYPPAIFVAPSNTTTNESNTVTLTCELEGKPHPTVTWLKGNTKLVPDGSRIITSNPWSYGRLVSTLRIQNANRSDEGAYSCRASNGIGANVTSSGVILTVQFGPIISTNPRNETRIVGDNVTLWCEVESKPLSTVSWHKDGISLSTDGRISNTIEAFSGRVISTLIITIVFSSDEGLYNCAANNSLGTAASDSDTGFLVVNLKPTTMAPTTSLPTTTPLPSQVTILNPYSNFTATESESAILVCNASSVTQVTITWLRDGSEITATDTRISGHKVSSLLKIPKVLAKDSGDYKCIAKNDRKAASTIMRLLIDVPVHVNMDISIEGKTFKEELRNESSPQFQQLANDFETQMASLYQDVEGFKEVKVLGFTNGSIKVRFRVIFVIKVNKPKDAPPPDVKQKVANVAITQITKRNGVVGNFTFKPESFVPQVPPPPPRKLKATEIKQTQVTIAWESPTNHKYYGISNYIVQHRKYGTKDWTNDKIAKTSRNYIISNLKSGTSLTISVLAINSMGRGVPSNVIEIKTDENIFIVIWRDYKWVVVAVGAVLILLILVGICLCCRRSRRCGRRVHNRSIRSKYNFAVQSKDFESNGLEMTQLASRFQEIPRDQVLIGKPLGSGQFGQVVRGYLQESNRHCAIKMLKEGASRQDYKDLMNEIEIMSSIDAHPNIINFIGACTVEGPLYVVIELAEHGCLLDYLQKNQMCSVNEGRSISVLTKVDKMRIALDVVKGLEHLEKHRCVHRDLAARNVLLGVNMTAKLSDFGLARDVYTKGYYSQLSTKQKLPVRWMALEAIETLVATKESDIWSFGVLLWEIESGGEFPYDGLQAKEIISTLKKGNRLRQPPDCPIEIYAVMINCWKSDPRRRPTLENLTSVLDALLRTARRAETAAEFSTA